ncbi:MAG TPA: Na+/H+ antiporter, partial [Verrucomicrobiae bacterium]|nr:Na+/H+ antiporter [Verrucomicrobiae bacterium]
MLHLIELFIGLLAAVAGLALLSRRLPIPYPILLVLGGLLLALIPGLPRIRLNPDLVFLFFLPLLLYPAAIFMPWRDFRANLRQISLLAVGLVLFTTIAVGFLMHLWLPDFPLAAGFVLGAIVSPPDAVAATAVARHIRLPQRIVTILEGESLVNDATALVALRFAIVAAITGAFSFGHAIGQFFLVALGGIAIGLMVGMITVWIQKRIDDPPIEITLSLLTPLASYLLGEQAHASGVLAVVTTGLFHGWRLPEIMTFRTRLQAGPVWEMIEFLLNGLIFLLIGLQLPEAARRISGHSIAQLITYAALISATVIVIRILWIFPAAYLPRLLFKKSAREPAPNWRNVLIIAWTGMRGVVSLAAALSLPFTLPDGRSFPGRSLILFLTFVVILVTLVLQGLSLPPLIRLLGVHDEGRTQREERLARIKANEAALAALDELVRAPQTDSEAVDRLRVEYEDRIRQLKVSDSGEDYGPAGIFSSEYERLSRRVLEVERRTIITLRNEQVINDQSLRRIQRDIDLAEARLR